MVGDRRRCRKGMGAGGHWEDLRAADGRADQEAADEQADPVVQAREQPAPVDQIVAPHHEEADGEHEDRQPAEEPLGVHVGEDSGARLALVLNTLATTRFTWATEVELQRGLAAAFAARGLSVEREARLDVRNRVDFLIGRVGVEVKVAGAWLDVERQVVRYAESDRVDAVVVVTSRPDHTRIPTVVNGKPVVVHLVGSVL